MTTEILKPKRGRKSKKDIIISSQTNGISNDNVKLIYNETTNENEKKEPIETTFFLNDNETNQLNEFNVNMEVNKVTENSEENIVIKPITKKRGRKPKGGKIIEQNFQSLQQKETKPNIILHLKCSLKDLQCIGGYNSNFTSANIESFYFTGSKNELSYEIIENPDMNETPNKVDNFIKNSQNNKM